jgi:NitT/TauT family transport system substrate-binding protein
VTTIRLPKSYAACQSPMLFAREFLHEEGFTDVEYSIQESRYAFWSSSLAEGRVDMAIAFAPDIAYGIDQGLPLVMVGAAHVACYEIYAREDIATVGDLKGHKVGVVARDAQPGDFAFASSVFQYIGMNPGVDVELVGIDPGGLSGGVFDSGQIDALFAYPPAAYSIKTANRGHVLLDSHTDTPWKNELCCFVVTNRAFYEANPVAVRRGLRAILRAVDYANAKPEEAAQRLFDESWVRPLIYAQRAMDQVPYNVWREHKPEDSLRFFVLRLQESGLIGSTPDEIIAKGTDFSYFEELKEELAMFAAPAKNGVAAFNCDVEATPKYARRTPDHAPGATKRDI